MDYPLYPAEQYQKLKALFEEEDFFGYVPNYPRPLDFSPNNGQVFLLQNLTNGVLDG